MIATMADEHERSDGFNCIGCGAEVAQPDEREKTTLRDGAGGKRGFCAACLGGRAKERALEAAEATQETQDG